jgi:glycosyltransferase involved in cell wall biosynthesis
MPVPTISIIIPAYNAARTLSQTLTALCAAQPLPLEIIVVNDGSTDDTAQIAKSFGVRVLSLEKNIGAAAAKNRGADNAHGDILLFTDADIVPRQDIVANVLEVFQARGCDGMVGLLDENIPAKNWASQFKNLWMNFTYVRLENLPRIGLFYTSIAAMKRATFLELGGFDEHYRGASIAEDTEFGQRAWGQQVPIVLAPNVRVVHLKAYSVVEVLSEDFKRAYALTLMRLRKRGQPFFTSVPVFYQLAVPTINLTALLLLAALVLQNPFVWIAAFGVLIAFYVLNLPLLGFLRQKRGFGFAIRSALFLPLDVFVVGLGMLNAFFNYVLGIRY